MKLKTYLIYTLRYLFFQVNELKQFYCQHYHSNNVMAALAGQVRSEQHETTKKGIYKNEYH